MARNSLILVYHRVSNASLDPQRLTVAPNNFEAHLAYLKGNFDVVPLHELPSQTGGRIAITFDDGYADNAREVRAALTRAELPATFFVIAGHLGRRTEFWWDRLEFVLLEREPQNHAVEVEIKGTPLWANVRTRAGRERAYWALFWRLRSLPVPSIEEKLAEIERQLGVTVPFRSAHVMMTADDVQTLAGSEAFDIGAHTVDHPLLATQTAAVQQREIAASRAILEDVVGHSVTLFSYPYGGTDAVSELTIDFVRRAGYERACAVSGDPLTPRADPLWLPRRIVEDWDVDDFHTRLSGWLGD